MFGIDSPELLVIAVVALVVIGPKELPRHAAQLGQVDVPDARHGLGVPRPCRRDGAPVRSRRGEEAARRPRPVSTCRRSIRPSRSRARSRKAWPRARRPWPRPRVDDLRQSAGRARIGAADRGRAAAALSRCAEAAPDRVTPEAAPAVRRCRSCLPKPGCRRLPAEEKPAKAVAAELERQLAL